MSDTLEVMFFSNGNTAVFKGEEQVPELQKSWLLLYARYLQFQGVDLDKAVFILPSNQKVRVFKTSERDYNWRCVDG